MTEIRLACRLLQPKPCLAPLRAMLEGKQAQPMGPQGKIAGQRKIPRAASSGASLMVRILESLPAGSNFMHSVCCKAVTGAALQVHRVALYSIATVNFAANLAPGRPVCCQLHLKNHYCLVLTICTDDGAEADGRKEREEKPEPEANFALSGKLAAESNTVNGVVLVHQEPPESRKPSQMWRLYGFKNGTPLLPCADVNGYLSNLLLMSTILPLLCPYDSLT